MLRPRVIPVLLVQNKGLVKTCKFSNPVYLGDPINAIKIYNEKEVDELVILDIEASREVTGIDWKLLNRFNREAFMPMGYGGGIKNIQDIKRIINLGYEKVILNSIVLEKPSLISEASRVIGSQSLVVCVDILRAKDGSFHVYDHVSGKITEHNPYDYIKFLEMSGAGEVIIQSVDRDGTYQGYEMGFLQEVSAITKIPVIALGGASSLNDIKTVLKTDVSAAAAGSIFVFYGRLKAVLINYPSQKEIETEIL